MGIFGVFATRRQASGYQIFAKSVRRGAKTPMTKRAASKAKRNFRRHRGPFKNS